MYYILVLHFYFTALRHYSILKRPLSSKYILDLEISLELGLYSIYYIVFGLTIPPLVVGWDIMGYESEPLPSYNKLRNRSYSIKLKF